MRSGLGFTRALTSEDISIRLVCDEDLRYDYSQPWLQRRVMQGKSFNDRETSKKGNQCYRAKQRLSPKFKHWKCLLNLYVYLAQIPRLEAKIKAKEGIHTKKKKHSIPRPHGENGKKFKLHQEMGLENHKDCYSGILVCPILLSNPLILYSFFFYSRLLFGISFHMPTWIRPLPLKATPRTGAWCTSCSMYFI